MNQQSQVVGIERPVADKSQDSTLCSERGPFRSQIERRDSHERSIGSTPGEQPKLPGCSVGLPPAEQPFPAGEWGDVGAIAMKESPVTLQSSKARRLV